MILVSVLNIQLFLASSISLGAVACAIFIFSNRKIYLKSRTKILSVVLYLTYQAVQIIAVSKLVEIMAEMWVDSTGLATTTAGALIKLGLVPPAICANFFASKILSLMNPSAQEELP